MRKITLFLLLLVTASLVYFFGLRSSDPGSVKESILPGNDTSVVSSPVTESKTDAQVQPTLDTQTLPKSDDDKPILTTNAPAVKDEEPTAGYSILHEQLSNNLSRAGYSYNLSDCLESSMNNNLKREKPLSFDEMVATCTGSLGLSEKDKETVTSIFKQSIKEAQQPVDLSVWYECASKRKINNVTPCFQQVYRSTVDAFHEKAANQGDTLEAMDFQKKWNDEALNGITKLAKECPNDANLINEMYAHEC